jgi:hypothetical protein
MIILQKKIYNMKVGTEQTSRVVTFGMEMFIELLGIYVVHA